jgi:hypothetical protein
MTAHPLSVMTHTGALASRSARQRAAGVSIVIALGLCSAAHVAADTVYKCARADGSTEFSAKPCSSDAKPITVDSLSPYEKRQQAERVWRVEGIADRATAQACLDVYWRPLLKDPDSGKLIDGETITVASADRRLLVAEGRARNGFGGMNVQYFVCELDKQNAVYPADVHGDLHHIATSIEKYGIGFALPGTKK